MAKILIPSAALALGIAIAGMFGRYELDANTYIGKQRVVARIDRLTGNVEFCVPLLTLSDQPESEINQPNWCKRPHLP